MLQVSLTEHSAVVFPVGMAASPAARVASSASITESKNIPLPVSPTVEAAGESATARATGLAYQPTQPAMLTAPDTTTPLPLQNAPQVFDPTDKTHRGTT